MSATPDLLEDPGALHLAAEAAKGALKRLALTDAYSHGCHLLRARLRVVRRGAGPTGRLRSTPQSVGARAR